MNNSLKRLSLPDGTSFYTNLDNTNFFKAYYENAKKILALYDNFTQISCSIISERKTKWLLMKLKDPPTFLIELGLKNIGPRNIIRCLCCGLELTPKKDFD